MILSRQRWSTCKWTPPASQSSSALKRWKSWGWSVNAWGNDSGKLRQVVAWQQMTLLSSSHLHRKYWVNTFLHKCCEVGCFNSQVEKQFLYLYLMALTFNVHFITRSYKKSPLFISGFRWILRDDKRMKIISWFSAGWKQAFYGLSCVSSRSKSKF